MRRKIMIEIQNLTHSFGKKLVLKDISLTIEDGKIIGLIGINGAGKSTLMRLISGVYKVKDGEILLDHVQVDSSSKSKELLFFLPDEPYYGFNTTAESLARMYQGFYSKFDYPLYLNYVEKFKLNPKEKVMHYSKGMRRKLFLCLAIASQVKYLLLDEAFDGLDPLAREEFKHFLMEVFEKNPMTVIISSHSLKDLEDIIDNYIVLDQQRVLASGEILEGLEAFAKYQLAYTFPVKEEMFQKFNFTELKIVGKIVQIVVKRSDENLLELQKTNPVMMEELQMDFNDYFKNLVEEGMKEQ